MVTLTRRRWIPGLVGLALAAGALSLAPRTRAIADLPSRLTDQQFWGLTRQLSEPNGYFRSDNFLSNERWYQDVIPELVKRIKPGGVYLGVGPEQNFPYIIALKPAMAFIIDIRRGNLLEHLLYKAVIEMSADRADFLSRLFSRARPAGLTDAATVQQLFAAYDAVPSSTALYKRNQAAVIDWLEHRHHFPLSADDVKGIEYVYHDAFFVGGPQLNYSMGSSFGRGGSLPTYEELMLADDGTGTNRGYLASEAGFQELKAFEGRNLLVPVVGNFGGPKAIRAVGTYVKSHGGTVTAFYLSNVEQYLIQDDLWDTFCRNVATLPLDATSTFIYSGRGRPGGYGGGFRPRGFGGGGGYGGFRWRGWGLMTAIRPIEPDVQGCTAARAAN